MGNRDNKYIGLFLVITFSTSWSIWLVSGILFNQNTFSYNSEWLIAQLGVFAPSIFAIILIAVKEKKFSRKYLAYFGLIILSILLGWKIRNDDVKSISDFKEVTSNLVILTAVLTLLIIYLSNLYFPIKAEKPNYKLKWKWFASSLLFLPTLFLFSWYLSNYNSDYSISALDNGWMSFLNLMFCAFSVNLLLGGSLGEELGWRGFLLPKLIDKYNPITASLILGVIWAFWHLPVDLFANNNHGILNFVFRIIWTLPLSIIFTWFFIKTEGSLLIALFLHTSINFIPDLGFNNYESAIILMTIIIYPISFTVAYKMKE